MSKTILNTIVSNIAYHEEELRKLRIAQEVVSHLNDIPIRSVGAGVATEQVTGTPMFVVTRTGPKPEKTERPNSQMRRAAQRELRDRVANMMMDGRARQSGDVIARLGLETQEGKQSVYSALYYLTTQGTLMRDEHKRYVLNQPLGAMRVTEEA